MVSLMWFTMITAWKLWVPHKFLPSILSHKKGVTMCVVAVLISYCTWGLISSSVPRGVCVVFILLFMGKMAQLVKMEKSLNFSSTAELLFWLLELARLRLRSCLETGCPLNGLCLWARGGKGAPKSCQWHTVMTNSTVGHYGTFFYSTAHT